MSITRIELLKKATEIVNKGRVDQYGKPENNFKTIADLWSAYKEVKFSSTDVAMMMILLKVARISSGSATEDSFLDIAGYAACGAEVNSAENEQMPSVKAEDSFDNKIMCCKVPDSMLYETKSVPCN